MRYCVDAVEDGYARLENSENEAISVPCSDLPSDIREGDVLDFDGRTYTINVQASEERRRRVYEKYKSLFLK